MLRREARRTLIYVPIVHSQGDMGSLGQHLPVDVARHRVAQVHWVESQQRVRALGLDWPAVKVYQDGLPDAPREMLLEILQEVLHVEPTDIVHREYVDVALEQAAH